ncbi:mechanosensitive ion channel family protein [Corynebacterium lizhenjunii]|uniref:Mechanosensitive ion channel family protein n=1 Tax=Corynebacterium lizhenjunii TaxID=2709394 RepID=A0A7T0PAX1_9CORY|nr:mechanosensitive ion channel family protein [Corynebacterium lizhenjunii]QPK78795.1 mechanosensitive ion channel family protein [Corynebacterium lizhenjunii]
MSISDTIFLASTSPAGGTAGTAADAAADAADAVTQWWQDPTTREWLLEKPVAISIVLIIAMVGHWAAVHVINRLAKQAQESRTARKSGPLPALPLGLGKPLGRKKAARRETQSQQLEALDKAHENRRVSRIKTLAGVARSAVAIFIWVWAGVTILAQLGVNVAPLIASAGIVGVALGFGAQSLVKDFLSGIFMLLEDQYGIGDTIDLGNGIFGDVEDITLRITTVRDIDGALWYVRNGEILQVANHTDEYSIARVEIPVSLSANAHQAHKVIERAAQTGCEHADVTEMVLDAPEMLGMTKFDVDSVIYRVQARTLPGSQWAVQRFLQEHIWQAMHDEGIPTPYPFGKGVAPHDGL